MLRSVEKRVAQDLAEANALAASAGPMLVDDTLPLGGDNDSTLPMDVSTTMTTSVAAMLKRDDDSRLLDANIEDKSTAMPPKDRVDCANMLQCFPSMVANVYIWNMLLACPCFLINFSRERSKVFPLSSFHCRRCLRF